MVAMVKGSLDLAAEQTLEFPYYSRAKNGLDIASLHGIKSS
jgi:hypothetical protein